MRLAPRRFGPSLPAKGLIAGLAMAAMLAGPAAALDYLNVTVQPDRAVPAACLSFTTELPRGQASSLEPYLAITPAVDHSLEARGKDLCIGGLGLGLELKVRYLR